MNSKDELLIHRKENPSIEISTYDLENYSFVTISNNGPLIPESSLESIFDSGFTTKGEVKGTGLGLYMSKLIVENNHKGSIFAENLDEGVRFTIKLPSIL